MATLRLIPEFDKLLCKIEDVPAFPNETFRLGYPESIGDVASIVHQHDIAWRWYPLPGGAWRCRGRGRDELVFDMLLTPHEDFVEVEFALKNIGQSAWAQATAFNCFQCGSVPALRDHDGVRHFVRSGGSFHRLIELPRTFGPRPTIQFYGMEGAPPPDDLPFVHGFHATSPARIEPWMAIVSRDGTRLAATVSKPGLFLFQNHEYSCIHAATGFGSVVPGQTVVGRNRVYFVESTLPAWHARMTADLA